MIFGLPAGLGGERHGEEQQQRHGQQTSHSAETKRTEIIVTHPVTVKLSSAHVVVKGITFMMLLLFLSSPLGDICSGHENVTCSHVAHDKTHKCEFPEADEKPAECHKDRKRYNLKYLKLLPPAFP